MRCPPAGCGSLLRRADALAGLVLAMVLATLPVGCSAGEATTDPVAFDSGLNPYSVIVDKNVFHLSPPPAPELEIPAPAALPDIHLSGFVQTGNEVKVLLAVELPKTDPKAVPQTRYLALRQGDKEALDPDGNRGIVELVKADLGQEEVEVLNCGTRLTLTMRKDGFEGRAEAKLAAVRSVEALKARIPQIAAARAAVPPHPSADAAIRAEKAAAALAAGRLSRMNGSSGVLPR